jgi:hypothetical protein
METNKQFSLMHLALVGIGGALLAAIVIAIPAANVLRQPKIFGQPGGVGGRGNSDTDTPIVVQGGSMTFRSKDSSNRWVASGNGYCLDGADISALELNGVELTRKPQPASTPPNPTGWIGLSPGWSLILYGRDHSQGSGTTASSADGITLAAQDSTCKGTKPGTSVLLTPLPHPDPVTHENLNGFYPIADEPDDGQKPTGDTSSPSVRFMNSSSFCAGPNGNLKGDEDVCERMSTIQATVNGNTYYYNCKNGECAIGIGRFQH